MRIKDYGLRIKQNLYAVNSKVLWLFLIFGFNLILNPYNLQLGYAETVTLEEVPAMPKGTVLSEHEKMFGYRGKTGGFCLKPSKYGSYNDYSVYYEEPAVEQQVEQQAEGAQEAQPPSSIKMMYWLKDIKAFCGNYLIIMGDLSKYSTITFMIKGKKGGETFEIGMNDVISNKREDAVLVGSIYRYLPGGITTEWQQVKIPLTDFYGSDLSRVYSIVFQYNEIGRGEFWIDDLKFHTEHLVNREDNIYNKGYLLLDNFDHSGLNLLGRKSNTYKKLPSVCKHSRVKDVRHGEGGRSLKLYYDKGSTGWCGYYSLLNQIDGEYYDLSKYKSVSFFIKGEKGGETFELGMGDRNWITIGDSLKAGRIEKYLPKGITTGWQEVVIPLSDFGKLDLSQMGSFVINFNKKQKGILYIDDLKFHLKTEEELLEDW